MKITKENHLAKVRKNPKVKTVLKWILLIIFIVSILGVIVAQAGSALMPYEPKTSKAQAEYDQAIKLVCEYQLKALASAKIDDYRAGYLQDQAIDLNDLAAKEKTDCSKAKVQWLFQ
jgi:hypothetical protein